MSGMGTVHTIDPDPDTVLILENPSARFAVWDEVVESPSSPAVGRGGDLERSRTFSRAWLSRRETRREDAPTRSGHRRHDSLFGNGDGGGSSESTLVDLTEPQRVGFGDGVAEESHDGKSNSIEYHVSARHLMLASPWFRRALSNKSWTEADRDEKNRFCIRTSNWDAEAFLIFLNVIHLRNRQVPRSVTLEILAKIAVLVDYYECSEAMDLFSEIWVEKLQPVPATDGGMGRSRASKSSLPFFTAMAVACLNCSPIRKNHETHIHNTNSLSSTVGNGTGCSFSTQISLNKSMASEHS
jgi:hypothetical protein